MRPWTPFLQRHSSRPSSVSTWSASDGHFEEGDGVGVGCGVGFGVGFGIGFGVGAGVGVGTGPTGF